MRSRRVNLVWLLAIGSLIFAVLSVVVAYAMVRVRNAAAAGLHVDVARHRAASELEECFADLAALMKDHVRRVGVLHDRADVLLREVRRQSTHPDESDRIRTLERNFASHLHRWSELPATDEPGFEEALAGARKALEDELLRPARELEAYYSATMVHVADDHADLLRRTTSILVWVLSLGGFFGVASGFALSRGLSRSIRRLQVQVRDAAGKLDPASTEIIVTADGDVGALHDQLDSLSTRIERFVETLQQREREVMRAEQLAALGQLAAGVAHEVRNPLTSIKLLVQAEIEGRTDGGMPLEDLRIIAAEVQRMERSLQSFLDYARPPRLERRSVDLESLARTVVGLVRVRAERQRVRIVIDSSGRPATVFADGTQLQQVALNLILNSLDAMPHGGTLTITIRRTDRHVELIVADTGAGISPSMRDRLFQPFTTTKETGLGLGLVITRRIVDAHGGAIHVDSPSGAGAVFTVTLPGEAPVAAAPAEPAVAAFR